MTHFDEVLLLHRFATAGATNDMFEHEKPTVLIVDDNPEVLKTFTRWLHLEGFHVVTVRDGQAALRHVDGVDAIILDLRMPIMDGLEFLRHVRARAEHVPVAVVTGDYLMETAITDEFQHLNAEVLFKPVWVDELVTLAIRLVRQRLPRQIAC
jgi:CheY-like chemotaxis protein